MHPLQRINPDIGIGGGDEGLGVREGCKSCAGKGNSGRGWIPAVHLIGVEGDVAADVGGDDGCEAIGGCRQYPERMEVGARSRGERQQPAAEKSEGCSGMPARWKRVPTARSALQP